MLADSLTVTANLVWGEANRRQRTDWRIGHRNAWLAGCLSEGKPAFVDPTTLGKALESDHYLNIRTTRTLLEEVEVFFANNLLSSLVESAMLYCLRLKAAQSAARC